MKRCWLYGISFLSLTLNAFSAFAISQTDIDALKGRDILYSSPFEDGNKAIKLNSDNIQFSENFIDDGQLIIQQRTYPIDQLFIKNSEDKYENLAYLLNYDGIAHTYFIHYYDETRLAVKDEVAQLRQQTKDCIRDYVGAGVTAIADETMHHNLCLDNIFYRVANLFYEQSKELLIKDYKELSALWTRIYFNLSQPDNCYGKCGTIAQMQAYDKILNAKQQLILRDFLQFYTATLLLF